MLFKNKIPKEIDNMYHETFCVRIYVLKELAVFLHLNIHQILMICLKVLQYFLDLLLDAHILLVVYIHETRPTPPSPGRTGRATSSILSVFI